MGRSAASRKRVLLALLVASGIGTVIGGQIGNPQGNPLGASTGAATSTLTVDLVARYQFDGEVLTDSSGNGNTLDANTGGDLTVAGYDSANAAYLTGGSAGGSGNSHMHIEPGLLAQNSTDGYTLAAWIKVANRDQPKYVVSQGISESIFMKYLNLSGTGVDHTILCGVKDTDDASPTMSLGPDEAVASNGVWYHAVCVYDKDTDTITGYVNGVAGTPQAVATNFGALKDNPATANVGGTSIGCLPPSQNCTGAQAFTAITVDDVALWNRPLTSSEVGELYATNYASMNIGVGLEQGQDWRTSQIFADMVKQGRPWGSVAEPWTPLTGGSIDSNGWPNGDAAIILATGVEHLEGAYTLTFTGDATVAATGSSPGGSVTISGKTYNAGTDTTTATVTVASGGVNLWLAFTGETSGVKNVKLMRPGHGPSEVFNQEFLERVAHFPVLRTMDLTDTNDNLQTTWSTRVPESYAVHSRNGYGAAWELVIALGNETGEDLWINIPEGVDDDYIASLAALFRDNLNPSRKLYVEYSNELWNTLFSQTTNNKADAAASYAGGDPLDLGYGGSTTEFQREMRYVAYQARRHSEIFRTVFGDAAMMTRVRPVLAGHIANTSTITGPLAWLQVKYGDPSDYLYAIAAAPYIPHTGGGYTDDEGLTADDIFTRMNAIYDAGVKPYIEDWGDEADAYGLALLAYEGGQHITGSPSAAAKLAAQSDPRMGTITTTLLQDWRANGGDLFVYFNLCSVQDSNGYWGLSDDITDESTVKWQAVLALM